MKKRLLKIFCFSLIFILVFYQIWNILSYKDTHDADIWSFNHFYKTPKNTIDVMFYGNSHCFCSVNTSILYNKYGIASFILAGAGKNIANIYYTIEESLKTQKPKLIFLEVCCLNSDLEESPDKRFYTDINSNLYRNTITMNYSKTFFNNITSLIPKEKQLNLLLKFPIFHSRYNNLTPMDFVDELYFNRGFDNEFTTRKAYAPKLTKKITPLPEKKLYYLEQTIQLVKNENIPLVFFAAPYNITEEKQETVNYAKTIAEKYDIPFIDFNVIYNEIELDYSTDLFDAEHINYNGATKVTNYLADFINSNYDLPNRKNDPNYTLWDLDLKYWKHIEKEHYLASIDSQEEFIDELCNFNDEYTTILYLNNPKTNYTNFPRSLNQYLNTVDISPTLLNNSIIYILQNNNVINSIPYGTNWYTQLDNKSDLAIRTNTKNQLQLIINSKSYLTDSKFNIVIYDNFLQKVIINK